MHPTQGCLLNAKGALFAEVKKYRSGDLAAPRTNVNGAEVTIAGPTAKPMQTTGGNGRAQFAALDPGNYTVTIDIPEPAWELYDLGAVATSLYSDVRPNQTEPYYFEIPWCWIEFTVKYPNGTFAEGLRYRLRLKKKKKAGGFDAAWTVRSENTTPNAKYVEDNVPMGHYELGLKIVSNPVWNKARLVTGVDIELAADVAGADAGAAGTFTIIDAHNFGSLVHTLNSTVTGAGATKKLKTTWKPTKEELASLKSDSVVFRARVAGSDVLSRPIPVFNKEKYQVVDDKGAKLDGQLKLSFSGGHEADATAARGEAEVESPWEQILIRVDLPDHKGSRAELEGAGPKRKFAVPA